MFNNGYQGYPYNQNYGYQNYQRNYQNPPQQSQPQMQNYAPVPQVQYEIPIQDVRFVTSEEAKAYIVMPNSKALLIDKNGTAYLKTADNMGQSQTQYFRFEAVNPDGTPIKPTNDNEKIDFDNFIKKDQIKSFGFATEEDLNKVIYELETIKKILAQSKKSEGAK